MPSSVIAHMSYDDATETLRIRFVSGLVYDYLHVSKKEYEAMKKAKSKGTYLNQHIKGKHDFLRKDE